jgi:NTP pyrophosphatase (non-canonical NTP hydrolase)
VTPMTPEQVQARVSAAVHNAIKAWGTEAQWRQVQEECAELIAAINRLDRGRVTLDDVADEIADVILCMGTARVLVGCARVDARVIAKLERLERRLDESPTKAPNK